MTINTVNHHGNNWTRHTTGKEAPDFQHASPRARVEFVWFCPMTTTSGLSTAPIDQTNIAWANVLAYRVLPPEPVECWAVVKNGAVWPFATRDQAETFLKTRVGAAEVILLREAQPEDDE